MFFQNISYFYWFNHAKKTILTFNTAWWQTKIFIRVLIFLTFRQPYWCRFVLYGKVLGNRNCTKLYLLHDTDQTTQHLVNQRTNVINLCLRLNRDKTFNPEIFEWNTLTKQIFLVWKIEERLVEMILLNRETLQRQVVGDLKT